MLTTLGLTKPVALEAGLALSKSATSSKADTKYSLRPEFLLLAAIPSTRRNRFMAWPSTDFVHRPNCVEIAMQSPETF